MKSFIRNLLLCLAVTACKQGGSPGSGDAWVDVVCTVDCPNTVVNLDYSRIGGFAMPSNYPIGSRVTVTLDNVARTFTFSTYQYFNGQANPVLLCGPRTKGQVEYNLLMSNLAKMYLGTCTVDVADAGIGRLIMASRVASASYVLETSDGQKGKPIMFASADFEQQMRGLINESCAVPANQ